MSVRGLYVESEREAETSAPAVELLDVFRIFSAGGAETVALRGLSMRVEPGRVVAVHGPSGSGKSTFLHLVAGLDTPSAGEVRSASRSSSRYSSTSQPGCTCPRNTWRSNSLAFVA